MATPWTSVPEILVNGAPLDPLVSNLLLRVRVENSTHLPDEFELSFLDPQGLVIEEGVFEIGAPVVINCLAGGDEPALLTVGEVTAVEFEYDALGAFTIIRGLDMSNHLLKGKYTRFFENQMASDIVAQILSENGIPPGEIVPTDDLILYICQAGITDWQFIQQLAHNYGYRAWMMDGVFNFAPIDPPAVTGGDVPDLDYEMTTPTQIVVPQGLTRLRVTVRATEQVDDVNVMGWSPLEGAPVVGEMAPTSIGVEIATQPEEVANLSDPDPPKIFTHLWYPTDDEDAAITKAEAIGNMLAEAYAEIDGECVGNPYLKPGVGITLSGAGVMFEGGYTLTSTRHYFDEDANYMTQFRVSGWQDRTLYGLSSDTLTTPAMEPFRIPGVVSATVVDVRDPLEQGRVQVLFDWMSGPDPVLSPFIRCVHFGVFEGAGTLFVPEEGTEVLVAFEQGDPSKPYVIGSLYNAEFEAGASPELIDEATGLVNERRISSRFLHNITFYDSEEQQGILIQTGDEVAGIFLNAEEQVISIYNLDGGIEISGMDIMISAEGDLSLESVGELSLTGASITIEGEGDVNINGASVSMEGDADLSIDAPIVTING
jgi:phage protein D